MKSEQKPELKADKIDLPPKKPVSDFLLGIIMFVAFIIFMALWLHFNLPETHERTAVHSSSSSMNLTTTILAENSPMAYAAPGHADRITSF
jgi:hypothetical protein